MMGWWVTYYFIMLDSDATAARGYVADGAFAYHMPPKENTLLASHTTIQRTIMSR